MDNNLFHFMDTVKIAKVIRAYYKLKGQIWPDAQDAATFTAQEAMEALDLIMRRKNYLRNHSKPVDSLGRELAQCFLMLMVTFMIEELDPDTEVYRLLVTDTMDHYITDKETQS